MHATSEQRAPVTVIGLGSMGTALARAFLRAGHPTTVWNRTPEKADGLVAEGAVRAATVAEAASAAELIVICVLDHRAVRAILDAAGDALAGRVVVNLTSSTPEEARQAAARAAERGVRYLDGAIMAVPTMIGSERALIFYGGPEEVYRRLEPTLAAVAGAGAYLGEDVGRPSLFDVALLGLMWTTWAGFIHALALVTGGKVEAAEFLPHARTWFDHVIAPEVPRIAEQVDRRRHPGDGSALAMQAAAIDHLVEAGRALKVDTELPEYLQDRARQAIERGHADDSFASLFEVLSAPTD